jgi:hypothetical protein
MKHIGKFAKNIGIVNGKFVISSKWNSSIGCIEESKVHKYLHFNYCWEIFPIVSKWN